MAEKTLKEKVDENTRSIRITGIKIDFLHLGQGLIDFIEASDLTRKEATALKEKYEREYQVEVGSLRSGKQDIYVIHARRRK